MGQKIAMTTDYIKDNGCPELYLKRISEVGFTHIMWSHHWNDDFIYSDTAIEQISKWLKKYNLQLLYVHASRGKKKDWISQKESERQAGIELVKNRIYMASKLLCDTIIMHLHYEPKDKIAKALYWNTLHKTLGELKTFAKKHKIRIALENLADSTIDCNELKRLFSEYNSDFLGFCYDTGHGNIRNGLELLELFKDRLIAVHLNDNDGYTSEHKHLFSGTIDWKKVSKLLAQSNYAKCMSIEIFTQKPGIKEESEFLKKAYKLGIKFSKMVEEERKQNSSIAITSFNPKQASR